MSAFGEGRENMLNTFSYPKTAMERGMKVREVILRAMM
jgi:hypothetical protein